MESIRRSAGAVPQKIVACLLTAGLLTACSDREQPAAPFSLVDSAGITIATSSAPAWEDGTPWRIAPTPLLVLTGDEEPFSDIVDARRLADGSLAVADGEALTVRIYGSDGILLRTFGGRGDGPGEFRAIRQMFLSGDSLVVTDPTLRRISLFALDSRAVRVAGIRGDSGRASTPLPIGRLPDGRFVSHERPGFSNLDTAGQYRDTSRIHLAQADGATGKPWLTLPAMDALVLTSSRFVSTQPLPFGRRTSVRVRGGRLWAGTGDSYRLDEYDPATGRLLRSVRWAREAEPVPEGVVAALRDSAATLRDAETSAFREFFDVWVRVLDRARIPEVKPPYDTFVIAADGGLWVREYPDSLEARGPSTWHIFGPDGKLLGPITLPEGFTPTEIGHDYLLGVRLDQDDVPTVVLFPLLKR